MVTDSLIWKNTYDFDLAEADALPSEYSIDHSDDSSDSQILGPVWDIEKSVFSEKLKEYDIIQNNVEFFSQSTISSPETLEMILAKKKGTSDINEYINEDR